MEQSQRLVSVPEHPTPGHTDDRQEGKIKVLNLFLELVKYLLIHKECQDHTVLISINQNILYCS